MKSKILVMFQQQNQCQHRLNCVLPCAHSCQTIAEITNGCNFTASNSTRKQFDGSKQLPFENISGKRWMIFFLLGGCQSFLKRLLCHLEVGWPFVSPFHSRVVWIIQLLAGTFRQADKIMTLLSWVYCTLLGESIFVTIVKIYISDI